MNEIPEDIMISAISFANRAHEEMSYHGIVAVIAQAIIEERERINMNDRNAYRLAYAALASIDAPRTGFHLQPAIEAIKQEYAAIAKKVS